MNDQRDRQTYSIIGAAMEVHRELGPGFLEAVYQEAMAVELVERQIQYEREKLLTIQYKRRPLQTKYRSDFLCFDRVAVEIKAIKHLTEVDEAQLINYLKATGFTVGLLINFGETSLVYRRLVYHHRD